MAGRQDLLESLPPQGSEAYRLRAPRQAAGPRALVPNAPPPGSGPATFAPRQGSKASVLSATRLGLKVNDFWAPWLGSKALGLSAPWLGSEG